MDYVVSIAVSILALAVGIRWYLVMSRNRPTLVNRLYAFSLMMLMATLALLAATIHFWGVGWLSEMLRRFATVTE